MGKAFTLIDVLVSMGVIGILIGMLLPGLAGVTKTARRVACSSNVRQLGLGLYMYADDYKGYLVPSTFVPGWHPPGQGANYVPQDMIQIRFADSPSQPIQPLPFSNSWDGLGFLFAGDYLPAPKIFYCPAHRGDHPFSKYAMSFGAAPADVISNYQYRGQGPNGTRFLHEIIPSDAALIADGMKTKMDYNHKIGVNILRADQGVTWFDDSDHALADSLPDDDSGAGAATVKNAWKTLDGPPR